jgi:hypothetical protein
MYPLTKKLAGFGLGLFVIMAGGVARPAFADTKVSQVIIAGTRSASVTSPAFVEVSSTPAAHGAQTQNGTVTLTADDSSGSGAGWNVTLRSSDFVYTGTNGGTNIPAANFSLTTINAPTATAGEAVDGANGPMVPAGLSAGQPTLESGVTVLQARPNYGMGTYTQVIGTRLVVPALSRAGTYTGTLTATIATAP